MALRDAERPLQERPAVEVAKARSARRSAYLIRFGFGAAVSVLAAVLGLAGGHRFGGLFLAFPAILPAALTLLEKKEGLAQAVSDVRGAVIGAVGMLAFAVVAAQLMRSATPVALPAALGAWVITSAAVYVLMRSLVHVFGERQYMPEIPTVEALPVITALRERRLSIAVAESCTGGAIAALLTAVPGAGAVMRGGVVAYDDGVKQDTLGVSPEVIAERGSVNAAVAREMAQGVKQRLRADVGLAITGLLGPHDGDEEGATYIALCMPDGRVLLRHYAEDHGPGRNRERDIRMALRLVLDGVSGEPH
ncbi:MAG: nicotinamide-nucleotide amidohydrolase family protein [Candidatus Dormibacteraeota bacterium]|nr:nicotinamide-nucleotide amidohydrolase family protein [Candidatus Dormibacteraeota bacterium]MBV9524677.1 nicotinamide-nucleotide amidohydrolase family protein [Candidatus Dormibacteraeota bacterium]